jgi:hypothetical protein
MKAGTIETLLHTVSTELHGIMILNTTTFTLTAVRTLKLQLESWISYCRDIVGSHTALSMFNSEN